MIRLPGTTDPLLGRPFALYDTVLDARANAVGLDQVKFASCLDSNKFSKTVQEDMAAGQQVGVSGTPAFFINGVMLSGAMPFDEFKRVIDQELGTN